MSGRTRAPDGAWQAPQEERREVLLELGPATLRTMATLVAALSPTGPGGRRVTKREARRLLTEATTLVATLRDVLGDRADADGVEV